MMHRRRSTLLLAALLCAATALAYAPVHRAEFVAIDDPDYVPENAAVLGGLRAEGVAWAFGAAHAGNWIPLAWLSHMTDVTLFGPEPGAHHLVSVALHAANAALLFTVLASATGAPAPSFAAAALFALHPANVESVAWVSQRKTVLSTCFGLLAIAAYLRFARAGSRAAYAASLAAFAASLLAKQTLVTLPFALLLLDAWPLRRLDAATARARIVEKLPYAALALAAGAATLLAQGEALATGASFPLAVRLGNAVVSVVRYVALFFWPVGLSPFYPLEPTDVTPARVLGAGALAAAATLFVLRQRSARPALATGWLWFLLTLAPVIGVVQVGAQAMADRYAYVPFWGLAIASVWSIAGVLRGAGARRAAIGAGLALALGLGVLTHRQATAWQSSIALFEHAVATDPANYVAQRALAAQYFERREYWLARQHAEAGARHPRDLGAFLPLYGMALFQTGSHEEALATLEEATRLAPRDALAFSNLGWARLERGDAAGAREALREAVALDPARSAPLYQLAVAELRLGDPAAASDTLARCVAIDPLHFDAWVLRVRVLAGLGRDDEARATLERAVAAAGGFPAEHRPALLAALERMRAELGGGGAAR